MSGSDWLTASTPKRTLMVLLCECEVRGKVVEGAFHPLRFTCPLGQAHLIDQPHVFNCTAQYHLASIPNVSLVSFNPFSSSHHYSTSVTSISVYQQPRIASLALCHLI